LTRHQGGTVSENKRDGVYVNSGARVTVAKAEEDKVQTVSKDIKGADWHALATGQRHLDGEIIGIPQEKINTRNAGYRRIDNYKYVQPRVYHVARHLRSPIYGLASCSSVCSASSSSFRVLPMMAPG